MRYINDIIKTKFKYSNFSVGLLNKNNNNLLDIINEDGDRLIKNIIIMNFLSFRETIKITNGKLYVNWLNIFQLSKNNYLNSDFYKKSVIEIDKLKNNISNFYNLDNYGLWFGDYFNVIRNGYYER